MPRVAFEHYADDPNSGYFEITEGSLPAIHVGMADPDTPDEPPALFLSLDDDSEGITVPLGMVKMLAAVMVSIVEVKH